MIERAAMNHVVAKRYRKGYVLRFWLLGLMGIVSFLILSYASAAQALHATPAWDATAAGTVNGHRAFCGLAGQSYNYTLRLQNSFSTTPPKPSTYATSPFGYRCPEDSTGGPLLCPTQSWRELGFLLDGATSPT
jgi:hypothetical protein